MDHNTADAAGYVYYRPVPESADAPLAEYTTGLTYMANTWQNNVEVGRTIAHEEMHHRGITDDGVAESWAQYCVN